MWISDERLLSQTREGNGRWGRIQFQIGYDEDCDFLIILNRSKSWLKTRLPRDRIWGVIQEPPNEIFKAMHRGQPWMGRVYNQLYGAQRTGGRFFQSHPMIPWFAGYSYEEAKDLAPIEKDLNLSCITSKTRFFKGHQHRFSILENFQKAYPEIELFGRGYRFVENKNEAFARYRYSLVMENSRYPYYFTEKIFDCLLNWTVPIYFGSPNITDFLPQDCVIELSGSAQETDSQISNLTPEDYQRRLGAIAEARRLILNELSLFAYLANEIENADRDLAKAGHTLVGPVSPSVLETWGRSKTREISLKLGLA